MNRKVIHVMKVTRSFSLVLLVSIAAFGQAQNIRVQLQAKYDKISRLSSALDKRGLEAATLRNSTSNFTFTDLMKNTFDLSNTIGLNKAQLGQVRKFISNGNKIVGMKKVGRDFICTVETSYDAIIKQPGNPRVSGVSVSEDTWTPTILGWKIVKSKTVKEKIFENGKAIKPKF